MLAGLRKKIKNSKRIVVKVGTNVLVDSSGKFNKRVAKNIVEDLSYAKHNFSKEIVLVSSGAIGLGMGELGIKKRPTTLPELQALASVGQSKLIQIYNSLFRKKNIHTGQVLLTLDDLKDRKRHLNTLNTLNSLLDKGVVPIVNENDTVAVDEIKFGDNDLLAAMLSITVRSDLLIILSNVDGFLESDGKKVFKHIIVDAENIYKHIKSKKTPLGVGGMKSKIDAVKMALKVGEIAVIANGKKKGTISKILNGEDEGTIFTSESEKLYGKKRWIAFFPDIAGKIIVDNGAVKALKESKKSLLPAGIVDVEGKFKEGSAVAISTVNGEDIGRGIVNYSANDIKKIIGCHTNEIVNKLGFCPYNEVIHRDNLVVY